MGGGEGAGDGLVGVADAHPVAVWLAGEGVEQVFLQGDAVLGFVFQDVGPALAEGLGQVGPGFQQVGGFPDEVVVVQGPLAQQAVLVAVVDAVEHPEEGVFVPGRGVVVTRPVAEALLNLLRPVALILGGADVGFGGALGGFAPARLALHAVIGQEGVPQVGVFVDPGVHGLVEEVVGLGFVQHDQLVATGGAAGGAADDFQPQAVQGAHVEAHHGQFLGLQLLADAVFEVVDAGVEVGDDEDLLTGAGIDPAGGDELGGEQREGEGFAAAGHGADGHAALAVLEDGFLGGTKVHGWLHDSQRWRGGQ